MNTHTASPIEALSPTQRAILEAVCGNRTYEQAAALLDVSERAVRNHMTVIFVKLGLWEEGDCTRKLPNACRQLGAYESLAAARR